MFAVDFSDMERYWLRAVLLNVEGATSFADLHAKCLAATTAPRDATASAIASSAGAASSASAPAGRGDTAAPPTAVAPLAAASAATETVTAAAASAPKRRAAGASSATVVVQSTPAEKRAGAWEQAARALGLVADDREYERAVEDLSLIHI